jgi:hypothetical protein
VVVLGGTGVRSRPGRRPDQGGKVMKIIAGVLVALSSILALPVSAPAATNVLKVTHAVNFGTKPVGSFTIKSATVTNTSS